MSVILEQIKNRSITLNKDLPWRDAVSLLEGHNDRIQWMEETKGEPTVIVYQDAFYLIDGSKESPDRRGLCYDKGARINRKKFPPVSSAVEECDAHGVQLMDEQMYRYLQTMGSFDLKTSSWVLNGRC